MLIGSDINSGKTNSIDLPYWNEDDRIDYHGDAITVSCD
jgi:hypothetical protein